MSYLALNKPEEALADVDRAIELGYKEGEVYDLRARSHESLQQYDAAYEDHNVRPTPLSFVQ